MSDELFSTYQSVSSKGILLVDTSGSVAGNFKKCTVFEKMENVISKLPETEFRICLWNSTSIQYPHIITKSNMSQIFKYFRTQITGTTQPHLGFHGIHPSWIDNITKTNIYLVTDGQMDTGLQYKHYLSQAITKLFSTYTNISLTIITVENRNMDFGSTEGLSSAAGSDIYKVIVDNKLTNYVNRFISYSLNNEDGFIQLNKNIPPPGHLPYGSSYFSETRILDFIEYIKVEIANHNNEDDLLAIIQNLSSTITYLIKDKPAQLVDQIISQFCNIFAGTVLDPMFVRFILSDSVKRECVGQASVYAEYRLKLKNLYKEANNLLLENVVNAININKFVTFPVANKMIMGHKSQVLDDVSYNNELYKKASIIYDGLTLPVLPIIEDITKFSGMNAQCLRQWVRFCASRSFKVNKMDDSIMYLMMMLNLQATVSNLPVCIKNTFQNIATIMLQKKRLNTDVTELSRLIAGDLPTPNNGKIEDFYKFMRIVSTTLKLTCEPMTMWYILCLALGNEDMINKQLIHCIDDIKKDYGDSINPRTLLTLITVDQLDCLDSPIETTLDYTCLISLENTSETGGYLLKPHNTSYNSVCAPICVFSKGIKEYYSNNSFSCPICYTKLTENSFESVGPYVKGVNATFFMEGTIDIFKNVPIVQVTPINTPTYKPIATTSVSLKGPSNTHKKIVVVMKGTVGSGKTTFSHKIKEKVEQKGGHCIIVGTDKYCSQGMSVSQAIAENKKEILSLNDVDNKLVVIIVDTCGDRNSSTIFDVAINGWQTINVWPNYNKNNMKGYLSWTLRNVLRRTFDTPDCYLKPDGSPATCVKVHANKVKSLFGNKVTLPSNLASLTVPKAIQVLDMDADAYADYLQTNLSISDQVDNYISQLKL